jgi:hypothetical protein
VEEVIVAAHQSILSSMNPFCIQRSRAAARTEGFVEDVAAVITFANEFIAALIVVCGLIERVVPPVLYTLMTLSGDAPPLKYAAKLPP